MSAAAIDSFEMKTDRTATRGSHLTGAFRAAFVICVAFVVLFALAALLLIAPIIFVVSALHTLANRRHRKTSARPRPDRQSDIPPIIEGDYRVIVDG